MSRIDGCDASRCAPPGPTDKAGVSPALNRAFQDRLDEARARLRDGNGDGGSVRRAEPRAAGPDRAEPRRTEPHRPEPHRAEPHRTEPEQASPGRADMPRPDARTAVPPRVVVDAADAAARSEGDDGLAAAPGTAPAAAPLAAAPGTPPAGHQAADDGTGTETARVVVDAGGRREPRTVAPRFEGERHGASGMESPQAPAAPFQAALARAEAARPSADAAAIAQWLIDRMPLSDPADRTVTLSFPGSTVPVERIVLVREAGVLHLTVQPRPDGHERVAGAMRALEERLRDRGLRVGSVRLS